MLRFVYLSSVLLISILLGVQGFKSQDFKKCKDAAFCSRLRGKQNLEGYAVQADSVVVGEYEVTATVANKADPNGTLVMRLVSYDGPALRLHMTEKDDGKFGKKRYEVPSVLMASLDEKRVPFKLLSKTSNLLKLKIGEYTFAMKYDPIRLDVSETVWETMMSWNGEKQFAFEHHREKKEGDPEGWWEESFNSHKDSKPWGPEAISFDISWPKHSYIFGLPERATSLSLKSTVGEDGQPVSEPYRLYNLDVFEYLSESPFGLYGSIPFVMAYSLQNTIGVFWLNSAEMFVDVIKSEKLDGGMKTQWISESGVLDLFFLMGPKPSDVSAQYAMLTGGTALPQLFSLGYHQCRWNYKDQEDVSTVDSGFDHHNIPYDVLWLDIEHTNDKRYFSWDEKYFPTPAAMQDDLASRGRKMVTVVDPHIKKDENWAIYSEAKEMGLYVKDKNDQDYEGWCWPGSSMYPDWLSAKTRDWWAGKFSLSSYIGSTKNLYTWNDMNEPSVFNGPEITMHKDAKHDGGAEHRDLHNIFGYFYHMASADGHLKRGYSPEFDSPDGDRPFVLSRAFFAGSQRIGPIWTGDNAADWEHLAVSVPMVISIGLAGLPFNGADVGGFFGNPDAELMTRWYQLGTYYPFFRGHAHLESQRREPWLFGDEATTRIREAIRERYRLLPYLYTQFFHSNLTGTPILRPLWYEFPGEEGLVTREHVFMFGPSLLVSPVLHKGSSEVVVTVSSENIWFDMSDGRLLDKSKIDFRAFKASCTLDEGVRTYLKGGTMLVTKERPRRSTASMEKDPYTLIIGLNLYQVSEGDLYVDDGHSFAFQKGKYLYRQFTFRDYQLTSSQGALPDSQTFNVPDGTFKPENKIEKIVVLGLAGGPAKWTVSYNGVELDASPGPIRLNPDLPQNLAMVIRKPGLSISSDWNLKFSKKEQ